MSEAVPYIYEIRDVTNDEIYATLGIYASLDTAIAELESLDDPERLLDNATTEYAKAEIIRRPTNGKRQEDIVYVREWVEVYDETTDDYSWEAKS